MLRHKIGAFGLRGKPRLVVSAIECCQGRAGSRVLRRDAQHLKEVLLCAAGVAVRFFQTGQLQAGGEVIRAEFERVL